MSIRLCDIAEKVGLGIFGDGELEISSLKYAREADENSLAIACTDNEILQTSAQAVLTEPRLLPARKSFLYCGFHELCAAAVDVAKIFIAAGVYPDYEKNFPYTFKDGSIFGENVSIGKNCRIEAGAFIGSGTQIGDGVKILSGSRVGVNCHYHFDVGGRQKSFCGVGRTIIGDGVEIGANTVIQRGTFSDTVIGAGTIIGNLVEIAHDVKIGANCLIVSQVGICGNVTIGERVQIFGQAGVANWVTVGDDAIILAKSGVTRDVRAGQKILGTFLRKIIEEE